MKLIKFLCAKHYLDIAPGHSIFKLFNGFTNAALIAWKLTVANAMPPAIAAASKNIHH